MSKSILHRVLEPFPDAASALSRARAIMRELAEWQGLPWPQLSPVTTAAQYVHAVRTFGTGRFAGEPAPSAVGPFLGELTRRGVAFERRGPDWLFMVDARLRPELAELWPLPEDLELILSLTPPFGGPGTEPEDECTEEELDQMVLALGPLALDAGWDCRWRGLPDAKGCGVQLCLNSVWTAQHAEPAPGEFGVWISLGARSAWTPAAQAWLRETGLPLGGPQAG
ncbi:hypothetical protein [Streptomyces sp. NPDC005435]|uniref:hypothetical protein n=1 Tax=Streptomyces sp. NPDC005435 TaxID=3154464 RepID=UPI003451B9FF